MDSLDFSIVIPTHNSLREKNFCLYYTLKAIQRQTVAPLEVIIVDDRGTDEAISRISREFSFLKIVRSDTDINNLGRLRNLGAHHAQGKLLLFLDDDTVLSSRETLRNVGQLMQSLDFCCGAQRFWSSIYWHRHIHELQSIDSAIGTLREISILPKGINRTNGFRDLNEFTFIGNFGCIHRDLFHGMGGFDENFPGWGFEDTDLMMRLCLKDVKYEILARHSMSVFHLSHPANVQDDFIRNFKRFNALEVERGYYFHANHFFEVYEGDGFSVLSKI